MRLQEILNESAVSELKSALLAKKDTLQNSNEDQLYDRIDTIMQRISKKHEISGKQLHDLWVKEYKDIPDKWIIKK